MEAVIPQLEEFDPPTIFGGFLHVVVSHALLVKGSFDFAHVEDASRSVIITVAIGFGCGDVVEAAVKGKAVDLIGRADR